MLTTRPKRRSLIINNDNNNNNNNNNNNKNTEFSETLSPEDAAYGQKRNVGIYENIGKIYMSISATRTFSPKHFKVTIIFIFSDLLFQHPARAVACGVLLSLYNERRDVSNFSWRKWRVFMYGGICAECARNIWNPDYGRVRLNNGGDINKLHLPTENYRARRQTLFTLAQHHSTINYSKLLHYKTNYFSLHLVHLETKFQCKTNYTASTSVDKNLLTT